MSNLIPVSSQEIGDGGLMSREAPMQAKIGQVAVGISSDEFRFIEDVQVFDRLCLVLREGEVDIAVPASLGPLPPLQVSPIGTPTETPMWFIVKVNHFESYSS